MNTEASKQNTIILCLKCQQLLRVPTDRGTLNVTCTKCRHRWDWGPPNTNCHHRWGPPKVWAGVIAVVVIVIILATVIARISTTGRDAGNSTQQHDELAALKLELVRLASQSDTESRDQSVHAALKKWTELAKKEPSRAHEIRELCIETAAGDFKLAWAASVALPEEDKAKIVKKWFSKGFRRQAGEAFANLPPELAEDIWEKLVKSSNGEEAELLAVSPDGTLLAHKGAVRFVGGPLEGRLKAAD